MNKFYWMQSLILLMLLIMVNVICQATLTQSVNQNPYILLLGDSSLLKVKTKGVPRQVLL